MFRTRKLLMPRKVAVSLLSMAAHYPPSRRYALVEHSLHNPALICFLGKLDTKALPVAARPGRLNGQMYCFVTIEHRPVTVHKLPSTLDDVRQALQLLASHGSLDIGQAIVIAESRVGLESDLTCPVPCAIGNAHSVLAQQPESRVPFSIGRGDHSPVAGAHDLARMERETGDIGVRLADFFPLALPLDLAADRACGVFHDRQ